jgi:hypothetical protein
MNALAAGPMLLAFGVFFGSCVFLAVVSLRGRRR